MCVEPFWPYLIKLIDAGYHVANHTALEFLQTADQWDAIYLLDVIEHMEREEGEQVIELCLERATQQIVVFTPYGFMEQDEDGWDLGGDYWQTHRSGWTPHDFPFWHCYRYARGFYAIWTHIAN